MKKGKIRIILGATLVVLQIMSLMGNAKAGIGIQISFGSLALFVYDIISLVSYCFFGIVGVILLVSGVKAYMKGEQEEQEVEEKVVSKEPEELPGFTIPLSVIMPILIAIFVVIFAIVIILERS